MIKTSVTQRNIFIMIKFKTHNRIKWDFNGTKINYLMDIRIKSVWDGHKPWTFGDSIKILRLSDENQTILTGINVNSPITEVPK